MTKKQAFECGKANAIQIARHLGREAQFQDPGVFYEAIYEAEENSRQYAGHISYEIAALPNSGSLFDAYDEGVRIGATEMWKGMLKTESSVPTASVLICFEGPDAKKAAETYYNIIRKTPKYGPQHALESVDLKAVVSDIRLHDCSEHPLKNPVTVRRLPGSSQFRVRTPGGTKAFATSYHKAQAQRRILEIAEG